MQANQISSGRLYRPSEDPSCDGGEEEGEADDWSKGVMLGNVLDERWEEGEGGEAGEELS